MFNRFVTRSTPKGVRFFSSTNLSRTALFDWHAAQGGKNVPFAGYELPVQYKAGLMKEHLHCRENSSLFDVSHMGQLRIHGKDRTEFIERITVLDTQTLKTGEGSLSLITNENGGIKDDTVITTNEDHIYMVVNAACKEKDIAHMNKVLDDEFSNKDVHLELIDDRALIAVQGPKTQGVLEQIFETSLKDQFFMNSTVLRIPKLDTEVIATRCGYTGEDGFELSVHNDKAADLADLLTSIKSSEGNSIVSPAGLGARDSLRLEAGLCLYGNEMNEDISPVEAILQWTITKRRKKEGGFIGHEGYMAKRKKGVVKEKRCCFVYEGRGAPAREGAEVVDNEGKTIGKVCSGGYGPSVAKNIGMAYVKNKYIKAGTEFQVKVRGRSYPVKVTRFPLTKPGYYRG